MKLGKYLSPHFSRAELMEQQLIGLDQLLPKELTLLFVHSLNVGLLCRNRSSEPKQMRVL